MHGDNAACPYGSMPIFGGNEKCSVGADASVRPWGNGKFDATYRKKRSCPVRVDVGIDPYKR